MLIKFLFILLGLIVGFLQYGLIKTAAKYTAEKKGGVFGVIAIKFLLYGVIGTLAYFLFMEHLAVCAAGLATGIIITAIVDMIRNKKA